MLFVSGRVESRASLILPSKPFKPILWFPNISGKIELKVPPTLPTFTTKPTL